MVNILDVSLKFISSVVLFLLFGYFIGADIKTPTNLALILIFSIVLTTILIIHMKNKENKKK